MLEELMILDIPQKSMGQYMKFRLVQALYVATVLWYSSGIKRVNSLKSASFTEHLTKQYEEIQGRS
jgi:hypothetical protein